MESAASRPLHPIKANQCTTPKRLVHFRLNFANNGSVVPNPRQTPISRIPIQMTNKVERTQLDAFIVKVRNNSTIIQWKQMQLQFHNYSCGTYRIK